MSTMQRVRAAIDSAHVAIEQTDFAKSLMDGRITCPAYCQYLTQMWHIHYQLEQKLPNCPVAGRFFEIDMIRTPAIARDIYTLGSAVELQVRMPETSIIEDQMQAWSRCAPFALLGCCYILEGSRMGSVLIGRALITSLGLQASDDMTETPGVQYHLQRAAQTPRRVKQLKNSIDAAELTSAQEQQLTMGACSFMSMLNDLYRQLPVFPRTVEQMPIQAAGCPMHSLMQPNLRSA